jgi:exo-beta-1,3-glucanase (GH17 family)
MRLPLGLFAVLAAAIFAAWWWLGLPVQMPPSPLDPGEKLNCVSYAPFRGSQTPLDTTTYIAASQIDEDLALLASVTRCVRTYSTDVGLDQVPEIARRHGLKVIQGLWLSSLPARNALEIETAIELANRYPDVVSAVVVGNEVLLRGEMTQADLLAFIRQVKSRVQVPVTYADVWEFWLRNPAILDAVDFVTIHILPYWEDLPIAAKDAGAHIDSIRKKVAAEFPGKEILIGETGWPSMGRMREGALPSAVNQAQVMHDILTLARREGFRVNLIEAFDQPWKRFLEGTVGGHWGLYDADSRRIKFVWGGAVSDHPAWPWQAAAGVIMALLTFLAAAMGARKRVVSERDWLAICAIALAPGVLIGWAVANAPLESLGLGGWLRSLPLVAVAVAAPLITAASVGAGISIPSFAEILGHRSETPARGSLHFALGAVLVVIGVLATERALGLTFDPRYRDFGFAPLTAAVVPYLVLTVRRPSVGMRGTAEMAMAITLALCAAFIVFNETVANWQALWCSGALLLLALTLARVRAAPG